MSGRVCRQPPGGTGNRVWCLLVPCRDDFYWLVSGLTVTKGREGARAAFDIYTETWAQDPSQETRKKTVVELETDIIFLMPTETALAQHRANAK